jgi:hypothetical protein
MHCALLGLWELDSLDVQTSGNLIDAAENPSKVKTGFDTYAVATLARQGLRGLEDSISFCNEA